MIGPSRASQGGIASVVASWENVGLFKRWPIIFLETHSEGTKFAKFRVGLSALVRFIVLLASRRVACVHIHVARRISFWRKAIFASVASFFRVPVLLHLHSGGFPAFYHHESNALQQRVIRRILDHAEQLIVLSEGWYDLLAPISSNRNITIIRNFPELPLHWSSRGDKRKHTILFLGLLNRDKGFYDLLECCAVLGQDIPDLLVVCGGKGQQGEIAERIRQLKIEQYISLPGWIVGPDKEAWFARASLFVLPSYVEGVPMGILEAMAWGLPIVSTRVGGIPDIVRHGREGLLVEAGDVVGLQEALSRLLLDDEERARMGQAARQRIEEEFSSQHVMASLDHLYAPYVDMDVQPLELLGSCKREVKCL